MYSIILTRIYLELSDDNAFFALSYFITRKRELHKARHDRMFTESEKMRVNCGMLK